MTPEQVKGLDALVDIADINDEIQGWAEDHAEEIPAELKVMLENLCDICDQLPAHLTATGRIG